MLPGKCTDVTRLLSDALDRRLMLHERLQVRAHLPTCSGCRAYRGQLALLRTAAKAAAGREPDGDDGALQQNRMSDDRCVGFGVGQIRAGQIQRLVRLLTVAQHVADRAAELLVQRVQFLDSRRRLQVLDDIQRRAGGIQRLDQRKRLAGLRASGVVVDRDHRSRQEG